MIAQRYEDLVCWQLAAQLLDVVIVITESPKAQRDGDFCDQLRRSARSVCSNIAEGFGRFEPTEFARFLAIARGSLLEIDSLLQEAATRQLAPADKIASARSLYRRTIIPVTRLRNYLRSKAAKQQVARARAAKARTS